MAKKKASSKKRSAPAKPARSKPASTPRKLKQPAKELAGIQKEIRQVRSPLYSLNRKIKEAPTRYQERKLKKQRKEYLVSIETRLASLVDKRTELRTQIKEFKEHKKEKAVLQRKVKRLEKQIDEAAGNRELERATKLNHQLLKALGQIDDLDKKMGAELKTVDLTKFDREAEEEEGGEGYEIDGRSPYPVWLAQKQLEEDLANGEFEYYVIDGRRFSRESEIEITAYAAKFWVSAKRKTDKTPYVNRFVNFETLSVKYKYYKS